jgi:hypothetical protein
VVFTRIEHGRDIDVMITENRSDAPDNTRFVVISGDHHVTVWDGIDSIAVDPDDPGVFSRE